MRDVGNHAVVSAKPSVPARLSDYNLVGLILGVGVILSGGLFALTCGLERADAHRTFTVAAKDRCELLQRTLDRTVEAVYSVKALLQSDGAVSRGEFQSFATSVLAQHEEILALEWLPRIRAAERAAFIATVRSNGLPGYEIRDSTKPGIYQPAAERAEYFPVLYVEPQPANQIALGYDPSSEPTRAAAMQRARQTGKASATDAVRLLRREPGTTDVQVVMVFAPVGRPAVLPVVPGTGDGFIGYSRALVRVARLLDLAASDRLFADMDVMITSATASNSPQTIYRLNGRPAAATAATPRAEDWHWRGEVRFADRIWAVSCWPANPAPVWTWFSFSVLAGSLFSTGLGAGFMRVVLRRRTEQTAAEQALRQSQADLNHAQAVAQLGSWRSDVRSGQIQWSEETYRMFGILPGTSMTHASFMGTVHPEDREKVERTWQAALQGAPYEVEHRIRVGDTVKWVREKAEMEFGPDGKLRGGFGTVQDITALKRADADRERSAQQRRLALDAARMGWWHFDPVTGISSWDDRYEEIFGVQGHQSPNDEIINRIIHPDDRAGLLARVAAALNPDDPQPFAMEYRINRSDGTQRWVEAQGAVVFEGEGATRRAVSFVGTVLDITERKRTAAALRESEQRLRFALETIHTGAWDLDLVTHAAYRSIEHDRIFGYAELLPQWTYEMFLEHVLPPDRAAVDEKFRRATAQQADWDFECRIRRQDGAVRWIFAAGRYRQDASGAIRHVAGIVQDITPRKEAEQALQESEQRFRNLFDYSPDAVFVEDLKGRVLDVNPAACRLHGMPRAELVGKHVFDLVPPEQRAVVKKEFWRLVTGELHEVEGFAWTVDGHAVPVDITVSRIEYSGQPALVLLVRDITERRLNESALRRERERLRRMVDAAQIGIAFVAPEGKICEANAAFVEMVGWTAAEFTARAVTFPALLALEFRVAENAAMQQLQARGVVGPVEQAFLHKDGRRVPVLCNRVMLPGERREFVAMVLDLSEQRRLENALEDAAETERGRIARDLHDGLGQQLGGLLYLSRMLADDLRKRPATPTRQADDIHQLVKEALEQTRNVARGLHPVPPEPDGLMHALEALCERITQERQLECWFDCPLPVAVHDVRTATALYRIAQEALNNALKHSGASRIVIKLAAGDDSVQLDVTDNGGGLRNPSGGSGLGMQTMKHRTVLLGGQFSVQAAVGSGVAIVCRVPNVAPTGPNGTPALMLSERK
ncbi:MAG: PAS domain S-box protein [Verrucomicrobiota bacterium]